MDRRMVMDEMTVETFFIFLVGCIYIVWLFKMQSDTIVEKLDETLEESRKFMEEEGIELIFED